MNRRDSQIDTIGGHGTSLALQVQKLNPEHEAPRPASRCEAFCGFQEYEKCVPARYGGTRHNLTCYSMSQFPIIP